MRTVASTLKQTGQTVDSVQDGLHSVSVLSSAALESLWRLEASDSLSYPAFLSQTETHEPTGEGSLYARMGVRVSRVSPLFLSGTSEEPLPAACLTSPSLGTYLTFLL